VCGSAIQSAANTLSLGLPSHEMVYLLFSRSRSSSQLPQTGVNGHTLAVPLHRQMMLDNRGCQLANIATRHNPPRLQNGELLGDGADKI
jgi:hypothetical protein